MKLSNLKWNKQAIIYYYEENKSFYPLTRKIRWCVEKEIWRVFFSVRPFLGFFWV